MYTINNIPLKDYGLYISNQNGAAHLLDPKSQFFTEYGKEGYQITKRKANELDLNGFIIALDLIDFKSKLNALYTLFSSSGTKEIVLDNETFICFCEEGFKVDNVRNVGNVFAHINLKLTIVNG